MMQNRVAVRADGPQVHDRIYDVRLANLRERTEVVYVDEPVNYGTVHGSEAEPAYATPRAMGRDTPTAGLRIALVGVDLNCSASPLNEWRVGGYFLGESVIGPAGAWQEPDLARLPSNPVWQAASEDCPDQYGAIRTRAVSVAWIQCRGPPSLQVYPPSPESGSRDHIIVASLM
jgi:hypothetical protein